MKYNKENVVFGDNTEIPSDVYTIRVMKMTKKKSSKGNPMVETELEIVEPNNVVVGDKTVQTAGRRINRIYTLLDPTNPYGIGAMVEGLTKGGMRPSDVQGLDEGELFDDDNLQPFIGKCFQALVRCQPRKLTRKPTEEEIRDGKTDYQPMVDKETGQQLTKGFELITSWGDVVGPANSEGF